ncbi:MAG: hypothetical protein ACK6A9_20790 [Dolichospermum sp.]
MGSFFNKYVGVKNCRYDKGTGNREQGTGFAVSVSRTVLGNFTFRYLCRFFSAHLLLI